jgi:hypothetical protein
MLELSDIATSVLQGSNFKYFVRAESWLGDELLATDIPVIRGTETVDRSLNVPERVSLTVPRIYDGFDFSPYEDDSPLAANGQRLKIEVGIGVGFGQIEWLQRGWFLVVSSNVNGDTVEVKCWRMMTWILEGRLINPFQPSGTLTETVRKLVEPALTVRFDSALVDRSVPSGINYDDDRLASLNAVLDAWPAVGYINNEGDLYVTATAVDPTPVLTLSTEADGTVIEAVGSSSREGTYNAVVARGTASDGTTVQGIVAYDTTSARRYGGDFNPLPVPYYFESPLLTTAAQATAAARTRMDNIMRQTAKSYEVTMVPNPALQAGDVVGLETSNISDVGTVEAISLPYTVGTNDPMRLIVKALS